MYSSTKFSWLNEEHCISDRGPDRDKLCYSSARMDPVWTATPIHHRTQSTNEHNPPPTTNQSTHRFIKMSPTAAAARSPARRATWAPLTNYGSKLMDKLITSEPSPTPAPTRSTPNLVESPQPATAEWSLLTEDEARALVRAQLFPGHAPPFVLSEERRNMPRAEMKRLGRKVATENTMRRTHQVVHEVGPVTPDQRILRTFRRKSYTAPSDQFERSSAPLW